MIESNPKRQKIEMDSEESRITIGRAIDMTLKFNFEEFKSHVSSIDFDSYTKLSKRLYRLGLAMKNPRACFSDVTS
jgi:hypothetical protein